MGGHGPGLRPLPVGRAQADGVMDAEEDTVIVQKREPTAAVKVQSPAAQGVRLPALWGLRLDDDPVHLGKLLRQPV